jgi:hypothetical protein
MENAYANPWKCQSLGKTYLLLLAEPFLQKNEPKSKKELWKMGNSTLYQQLDELEKLGLYFKKPSQAPPEINFYVGTLEAMQKRRVKGIANPAGILKVLYDWFNVFTQTTNEGLNLHRVASCSLMLWGNNVLYQLPPSKIIKISDKFFGTHSLRNVCATLLLLAQANPVLFGKPLPKGKKPKPFNFDRQLKRKGLSLGDDAAQKLFKTHFS